MLEGALSLAQCSGSASPDLPLALVCQLSAATCTKEQRRRPGPLAGGKGW